jgi:uncharacterized BrkB/YihY/UPF0761 family membrane protein
MLLGIGFVLLVSLMLSAIVAGFSSYLNNLAPGLDAAGQLLSFLVSFGVTTFVFALIYKFVPDVNISWGDVWFGGIVTALLFSLGKTLIGLYLGNNSFGSTYVYLWGRRIRGYSAGMGLLLCPDPLLRSRVDSGIRPPLWVTHHPQ